MLGGILNAILGVVLAVLMMRLSSQLLRLIIVVVAAYFSSHAIFGVWSWLGFSDDQMSSWSFAFTSVWFVAGAVAGSAAVLVSTLMRKSGVDPNGS